MTNKKSTSPETAMRYFLPSDDPKMFVISFIEPECADGCAARKSNEPSAIASMQENHVLVRSETCFTEPNFPRSIQPAPEVPAGNANRLPPRPRRRAGSEAPENRRLWRLERPSANGRRHAGWRPAPGRVFRPLAGR